MARARLTEAERAARRQERNRRGFKEAKFRQYDPNDEIGLGNARQWRAAAGAATGHGFTMTDAPPKRRVSADLAQFGFSQLPSPAELHAAYRRLARITHPNAGGTDAAFIALREAYDRLMERIPRSKN